MPLLVLASGSPQRLELLRAAGVPVLVDPPGVPERDIPWTDAEQVVRTLAERKASAVSTRRPEAWVLGADQVAVDPVSGEPFGKPTSPEDHLARLQRLRGRPHRLVTGFALLGPGLRVVQTATTVLHVRADLTDHELAAYVATGEGAACAGGYAAEGRGAFLFERIDGDWQNVLGLPLFQVLGVLRDHGWSPFPASVTP